MKKYKSPFLVVLFCLVTTFAMAQKPKATIVSPVIGDTYKGNQEIIFKGSGFDSKDGNMDASTFRWLIFMNHGKGIAQHWHDGIGLYDGVSEGTFNTPLSDEHVVGDSIFYRFYLIVKNSKGISDTAYVDVVPKQSKLTIKTEPAGLKVNVQGNGLVNTPLVAFPTQNMLVPISALKNQTLNGVSYTFKGWSDGGKNASIAVMISDIETSLTAIYSMVNAVTDKLENTIFKIYPNPVNEVINLEANNEYINNSNIQIYNTSGKNIESNTISYTKETGKISIDTQKLSQGLYIIKINTDKGYALYPFSKQ